MQHITGNLYLGDVADLDNLGDITAVLTCAKSDQIYDAYLASRLGGRVRRRIAIDDGEEIPEHWIEAAIDTLDEWLPRGEKVLVHCAAGISRSPSIVIAWLMSQGKTYDEAEQIVGTARQIVFPHPDVKRSIKRYFGEWPYDGGYDEAC